MSDAGRATCIPAIASAMIAAAATPAAAPTSLPIAIEGGGRSSCFRPQNFPYSNFRMLLIQ
jgi:hypothetical protein